MKEIGRLKRRASHILGSTVVSEKGAIIQVKRIEISAWMKRELTTSVRYIGPPRRDRAGRN